MLTFLNANLPHTARVTCIIVAQDGVVSGVVAAHRVRGGALFQHEVACHGAVQPKLPRAVAGRAVPQVALHQEKQGQV